jgi:cobalt-zinc-cadmium efflux system protein
MGHQHNHAAGANSKMLTIALALTATFMIAEVVGGIYFNSLALLSDAAHMMTDVAALCIALIAIKMGQRPADEKRSFGYQRFEILAAAFNALLLFLVAIYIGIEAIDRFRTPQEVQSWGMLIVAALGLVINLISMRLLSVSKDKSFNVKGAYLEVWADMVGSIGVIGGALAIKFTGWTWIDPVIAVLIGLWVLPRTWILLRGTINVLLEGVPAGIDLAEVRAALRQLDGVADVHDLHIWSISNDSINATAHIVVSDQSSPAAVREAVCSLLHDRYGIEHSTVQTEEFGTPCQPHGHLHN